MTSPTLATSATAAALAGAHAPPTLRAVIFDMDGVLIDSEGVWQRVREDFARDLGARWTHDDQVATMGTSTADWSGLMVQRLGLRERAGLDAAATAEAIIARMLAQYREHLPLRDGAAQAVRAAASRYTVAFATGSPRVLAEHVLHASGLRPRVAALVCGDEVPRGKPAPDIYLQTLRELGLTPHDAVGVEDSANGLRALSAAGLPAVAVPGADFPLDAAVLALSDLQLGTMRALTLEALEGAWHHAMARRTERRPPVARAG